MPTGPPNDALYPLWRRPWDMAGLLLSLLYAAPALVYPHGNDQALHWYIGKGILQGELPFESGVSGKPIGIFVVHALARALFGDNQWAIRALEALTLLAMAPLLAALVRGPAERQRDGNVGAAAMLLFGLHYTFFDYWDISHPETWIGLCTMAAALISIRDKGPVRRVFLVGILSGSAFMFKYTAAVLALPIAAYCGLRAMIDAHRRGRSLLAALLRAAGLFLLGVAAVILLCILPFAIGGALEPMWEVLYTFTARYVKQAPGVPYTALWTRMIFGGAALVCAGAAITVGLAAYQLRKQRAAVARGALLLAIAAGALLSVWLQRRFFSYHFMVAVPWLAACILYGAAAVLPPKPTWQWAAVLALVGLAFAFEPRWCSNPKMTYVAHAKNAKAYLGGDMDRGHYLNAFLGMNYLDRYRIHEQIGLEIRRRSAPEDQLCVRGFAPSIYQVSGLRCPSRHVIQMWPAGLPHWDREFDTTIRKQRPRFIVTFADRPKEVRTLLRLGYRPTRMPSIYLLLEHRATGP